MVQNNSVVWVVTAPAQVRRGLGPPPGCRYFCYPACILPHVILNGKYFFEIHGDKMKEFTINHNDAGQRLDRFVSKAAPLLPEALLQKYIRIKRVKVNGKGGRREQRLCAGDRVQMYINDEFFERPTEENAWRKVNVPRLSVLYEDENILLAHKPAGVLCHAGDGGEWNTLIDNIKAYLFQKGEWEPDRENSFAPALCNRIDRNTQGIVIAAKTAEALRILDEKIKNREIDKFYLAAVHGRMEPPDGELSGYIFKDAVKNRVYVRQRPEPGAKRAVTRYRTLQYRDGLSLLECELLTGRTHQIRAQLAAAGRPLLGDGKYGTDKRSGELPGQALCSWKLRFSFRTDAGSLNYLKDQTFTVPNPSFVEKYFL